MRDIYKEIQEYCERNNTMREALVSCIMAIALALPQIMMSIFRKRTIQAFQKGDALDAGSARTLDDLMIQQKMPVQRRVIFSMKRMKVLVKVEPDRYYLDTDRIAVMKRRAIIIFLSMIALIAIVAVCLDALGL